MGERYMKNLSKSTHDKFLTSFDRFPAFGNLSLTSFSVRDRVFLKKNNKNVYLYICQTITCPNPSTPNLPLSRGNRGVPSDMLTGN